MQGYLRTLEAREYPVGIVQTPIHCFRCGLCCTTAFQVRLTIDDLHRLAGGLGLSNDAFLHRYVEMTTVGYVLRQTERECVFLIWDDDGNRAGCHVYPFRPEACRNWVPSLSRPECQEGLRNLRTGDQILLPTEMYTSTAEIAKLCSLLRSDSATLETDGPGP